MKCFEMANKQNDDGMRDFSIVLHEIYPEDTFSEDGTGSKTNENGLAWRRKWVEATKDTIVDKSLRVEFIDDSRTEIWGHGMTGYGADSLPHFEDATVIGHFTKSEIEIITFPDGSTRECLVGYGVIDAMCYPNFVEKLELEYVNGESIHGSVEIIKDKNHDAIIYENGYHKESRTPQNYIYSGYAILAIKEADSSAVLLEINEDVNGEDLNDMTDIEIKALVAQTVNEMSTHTTEINNCKDECEAKVAEANEARDQAIAEKNNLETANSELNATLSEVKSELERKEAELSELNSQIESLRNELNESKKKERINELNSAISGFTDEEKEYAKAEINAFTEDPLSSELNSVVNKIWEGIGKNAKAAEDKRLSEQNSANNIDDIFSGVDMTGGTDGDINIF